MIAHYLCPNGHETVVSPIGCKEPLTVECGDCSGGVVVIAKLIRAEERWGRRQMSPETDNVKGDAPDAFTTLAVYRNAFYTAMGVGNETKPTDAECIRWLTKVRQHAEQLQSFGNFPVQGMLPYWRIWIDELSSPSKRE